MIWRGGCNPPLLSRVILMSVWPVFSQGIGWDALFARTLKPPFVPTLRDPTDTSNFDEEFTSQKPILTPPEEAALLTRKEQTVFKDFDFVSRHLVDVWFLCCQNHEQIVTTLRECREDMAWAMEKPTEFIELVELMTSGWVCPASRVNLLWVSQPHFLEGCEMSVIFKE